MDLKEIISTSELTVNLFSFSLTSCTCINNSFHTHFAYTRNYNLRKLEQNACRHGISFWVITWSHEILLKLKSHRKNVEKFFATHIYKLSDREILRNYLYVVICLFSGKYEKDFVFIWFYFKQNVQTNLKYPPQLLFSCRVIVSHGLYTINEHILNAKMRKMRW